MADDPGMLALLARQDGLITSAQAAAYGTPARTLRRRARCAGWRRVAPQVFLAAGHPWTMRARVRTAGLWAGERGAVSGAAAAWWHAMPVAPPGTIEVTVPRGRCPVPPPGIRVRRRDLPAEDVVAVGGIRVTGAALAALETSAALRNGSVLLDRALQRHVGFADVYRAYCRNIGMRGSGRISELLVAAADRADSAAERLLITLLRRAGISGWTRGHPFGPWVVDVAFPGARIAVEVDGWAWHAGADRFQADRTKGNALVAAGWVLLRFTWHDLRDRPDHVVRDVRAALAVAAARP